LEGRHFGNTVLARGPGQAATAAWPRLALGCSVAVHAAVLATTLVALYRPAPVPKPEAEPIAVVFEAPQQAPSQPERPPNPDLASPSMTPASPTIPSLAELVPRLEPAPPVQAAEPAATPPPPPPPALSSAPPAVTPPPPLPTTVPSPPSEPPAPDSAPQSAISPPPPRTEAPVPATLPPIPSRRAPPRTLPRVARPAPASRPAAPPVRTLNSVEPPTQSSGPLQQAAPAIPGPAAQAQTEVSASWRSALANWLQSYRTYPDEARRRAEEGTVLVRFSVARDGHVLEVTLVRGSGSPTLDEAAQATFRNARMPPFPADMSQAQTTVTVPIRYRLEQ